MNIYAERGHKIIVTEKSSTSGMPHDADIVKKYLEIGKPYTVERTEVGDWRTDVYLQEVPNVVFNSVNFEDAIQSVQNN